VRLLDLLTVPDQDKRQRLIDRTRRLSSEALDRLLKEAQRGGG
jgi:hypothetical protein